MKTKREYILELIKLTKLQSEALEKEEVEEFIRLLDKRQEVLECIKDLEQESVEDRIELEALINELKALDEKNQVEFTKQYEEVKAKLREIRQRKVGEKSYGNPYDISREEGVFFDKRGPR